MMRVLYVWKNPSRVMKKYWIEGTHSRIKEVNYSTFWTFKSILSWNGDSIMLFCIEVFDFCFNLSTISPSCVSATYRQLFEYEAWNITRFCFCLKAVLCFFFKLIFDFQFSVSYSQLVQFSLQRAHDSIRKAIAGISKVSPLRISDLHVSFTDQMIPKWSTLNLKFKN